MTDIEEARRIFSKDRYAMATTGIEIEEVAHRYAKCSLKLDNRHKNAVGLVMGGAIFTLADFVFAVATNFRQPVTITVSSQINFLDIPKGSILYGESMIMKDGRNTCFYEIIITDNLNTLVAVVTTVGKRLEPLNNKA